MAGGFFTTEPLGKLHAPCLLKSASIVPQGSLAIW